MKIVFKILLSIAILIIGSLIHTALVISLGNKISTFGIGPYLLFPLIIGSIIAIWRYDRKSLPIYKTKLKKD